MSIIKMWMNQISYHSKTFMCVTTDTSYVPYYISLQLCICVKFEKINKRINEPESMSTLYRAIIAFSINLKYSERTIKINSKDTSFRIYLYKCKFKCKIRRDSLRFIHQSLSFICFKYFLIIFLYHLYHIFTIIFC